MVALLQTTLMVNINVPQTFGTYLLLFFIEPVKVTFGDGFKVEKNISKQIFSILFALPGLHSRGSVDDSFKF